MAAINMIRIALVCMGFLMVSPCLPQSRLVQTAFADTQDPFQGKVKFLDETPYVTKAVMGNGMTVLVNEHQMHPVVSIQIFVKAGIMDEPKGSPGIARLLSALVSRSEPDETGGSLRKNARILGAQIESSTDYEYTRFEILAPAARWKRALQAQFDALMNTSFDPDTVEVEKRLLLERAGGYLDDPSVFARESLLELGFGSFSIGKWSALVRGDPVPVSLEELTGFHRRMFVPERMMLVVSGDVRAGEVLNEAVRIYGDLKPAGNSGKSGRINGSQTNFRYRRMAGDVAVPHLLFGFHVPAFDSRDHAAVEVLNAILGLGNGSILASRLRDRKRVILNGTTGLSAGPGFGYLTILVEATPEDIDGSEIAVLTELELLKRKAPSAVDMQRAWAQLERAYRSRIETVSGRARMLAEFESLGGWQRIDRYIAELRAVRPEEVKRAAEEYLRMENCSLVEYLPEKMEVGKRTSDSVRSTLAGLLRPSTDQEEAQRERETVLAIDIPEGKSDYKFSQIRYPFTIASIYRGPEIYVREDHTAPLIHMGIFFPGGRLAETDENAGITSLLVRMMLQGTEKKSVWRFNRQLEVYGGQILPVVADEFFGFYFSIFSRNIGDGFKLVVEAVKTPALDPDVLEHRKMLLQLEGMRSPDWKESVEASIYPVLFRGFPYSRPAAGTERSIQGITPEALADWYNSYVKDRKPVVVIVGDTEGTSLASYFVRNFSGSRFLQTSIPDAYADPLEERETIEKSWDRSSSLVSIGFQAPPVRDIDRYAAEVLQSYFGDMGSLYREIEENMGVSSEIHVSYEPRLRGGSFLAYAVTSPDSEEDVLEAFEREFRHFVDRPVAYLDYRSAVNTAVASCHIRRQSPFAEIVDVAMNALAGESIEEFRSYETKLQSVYQEDLKEVAERYFSTEKAVLLRIHGKRPLVANESETE